MLRACAGTGAALACSGTTGPPARSLAARTLALRLETGTLLHDAHQIYARHGFAPRGPFGTCPDAPSSIFMEKSFSPATG